MRSVTPKYLALATAALLGLVRIGPAAAADGPVLITQDSVLAGNVTPGDAPGFPVTLSVSGSYKLASNLLVDAGALYGIVAAAPDITVDVNGFVISGGSVLSRNNARSALKGQHSGLTVKNGTIMNFTSSGIEFIGRKYLAVQNMTIKSNGGFGINNTYDARILDSTIVDNRGTGVASCMPCSANGSFFSCSVGC